MLTSSRVLHPNLPITYVVSCRLAPRVRPRLCGKSAGPAAPPLRTSPQSSGGMQRFRGEELGGPCTNHRRSSETGNISPTPSWRNILIYTPCWAGWEEVVSPPVGHCAPPKELHMHVSCHTSDRVGPWTLTALYTCVSLFNNVSWSVMINNADIILL